MSRSALPALAVGAVAAAVLLVAALLAPFDARHSAPFGFSQTLDSRRGIAVPGGFVDPNYPDFNRLDLDLRAYHPEADYDLTLHVRPDREGADDVRTVRLSLPGTAIRHDKPPFANPFRTVRFRPIANSAGRRYYVWIEAGPRNRDDVVTLWSIKSYSRVTGRAVLASFLADPPGDAAPRLMRTGLIALLLGLVVVFGWLLTAVTASARPSPPDEGPNTAPPVASGGRRWYTLGRLAHRPARRATTFDTFDRSGARRSRG